MPNKELLRYAGLATQFLAALGVAIFIGIKVDRALQLSFPITTILLPLAILMGMFYKIYKDSSKLK